MFGTWPNISGTFRVRRSENANHIIVDSSGAFSVGDDGDTEAALSHTGSAFTEQLVRFNASAYNSKFSGSKLQINALQVLACIRT